MKITRKLITITLLFFYVGYASSQTLFGLTASGGDSAGGVLFKYNVSSSNDSLVYQFPNSPSYPLYTNFIQASDGYLYGMASKTGSSNLGGIFRCTTSGVFTEILAFNNENGAYPQGSLIQASDGNLYGMTTNGGDSNKGVLFKCTTSGILTVLVNFSGTNGANPIGSLIQAKDGNLYGMTSAGGTANIGILFKCTTNGVLTVLVNFNGANGSQPYGSLLQALDGNLYGMTSVGGNGKGNIFKCSTSGSITNIFNFTGPYTDSAGTPYGNLIQAYDGNLYGMSCNGGTSAYGSIFKYDTTTKKVNIIAYFNGTNGDNPKGSLIQGIDSNFYGMTYGGGSSGKGNVFKANTNGIITNIGSFNGANGNSPWGSLIQASDGNLYGMTWLNNSPGFGTIFKCTTSGAITNLHVLGVTSTGCIPEASLLKASDGNFYGTTQSGGSSGLGTIFKYMPSSGIVTTIANFNGTNGASPFCDLMQASDGNLYGMTHGGGSAGDGTIFKCTLSGILTNIVSLSGSSGSGPYGGLVQASDGNLYGMTEYGGTSGQGNLFKCTTSGTLTNLVNFSNNEYPGSTLIKASDGNLYGTSSFVQGCTQQGIIFKVTIPSGTLTTLINFDTIKSKPSNPIGKMIQASDGNFYGTTFKGGLYCFGSIYKYSLISGVFTLIANFNDTNGAYPYGGLIQASDGNLYGITTNGGKFNYGTLYRCTTTGVVTKLLDFDMTNGAYPYMGVLLEYGSVPTVVGNIEPTSFFVSQNEPNPFIGNTKIIYDIPYPASVILTVYDVMGRRIMITDYGIVNAGENSILLDAKQFSSGVYFYTLNVNGQSVTKKMIVSSK